MISTSDSLRISQSVLTKAGAMGLQHTLKEGESLSAVLKYMVENSAIASGRRRSKSHRENVLKRRRYGSFVLVLKGHLLVGIYTPETNWCPECLGTRINCSCT